MRLIAGIVLGLLALAAPALAFSPLQVATVLPAYQAPGWSGFTPNSLLVAYWRSGALSDGAISSFADDIGAFTLTQATGSARPTKSATSCNGAPGVTFASASSQYLGASATTGLPTGSTEGWIFQDLTFTTSDASNHQPFTYGSTAANAQRGFNKNTQNRITVFTTTVNLLEQAALFSNYHILVSHFTSALVEGWIDGRPFTTPSAASSTNTATAFTRIGGSPAGTPINYWEGVICNTAVASGALTTNQRQQIEAYFAWLDNAPQVLIYNHPYRFRKP